MWKNLVENKEKHYEFENNPASRYPTNAQGKWNKYEGEKNWRKYVGL